ncbi:MAG: hypothetical protein QXE73_05305 [Candidatus Bathyarchaeia archaeon]
MFLEAKNGECACKAFVCNSANCGKAFSSGELWKAFRCVYDNSWEWVEAHPNNQVPTNFCCSDADCTAYNVTPIFTGFTGVNNHVLVMMTVNLVITVIVGFAVLLLLQLAVKLVNAAIEVMVGLVEEVA